MESNFPQSNEEQELMMFVAFSLGQIQKENVSPPDFCKKESERRRFFVISDFFINSK